MSTSRHAQICPLPRALCLWISVEVLIVPGLVKNLNCDKSPSPSELSFSWELPTELGDEVTGYRVEVKELQHREDTKDVVPIDVMDFSTEVGEASVNQGLGENLQKCS